MRVFVCVFTLRRPKAIVTASKVDSSKGKASADASANSRETLLPAEERLHERLGSWEGMMWRRLRMAAAAIVEVVVNAG
jgi:hypothetical protein